MVVMHNSRLQAYLIMLSAIVLVDVAQHVVVCLASLTKLHHYPHPVTWFHIEEAFELLRQ